MNLHEYQAKQLLAEYQLPVPASRVATTVEEANAACAALHTDKFVVKAQVHAGGRGKAGGVKIVSSKEEVAELAKSMLGTRLVTQQTDAAGQPIKQILIEAPCQIAKEFYLGAVIDRASQRIVFMASTEGGVEIEEVAAQTPEKIFKIEVNPLFGVLPYQARELAFQLGFSGTTLKSFTKLLTQLGELFVAADLSLLEINPLVLTEEQELLCLDAKVNIDDNALYRQPKLREQRDTTQEDERVNRAHEWELNYIPLDGNIGCMVNGAGLAMATMDLVKLHGGRPANFLDVGGGATQDRVSEAFKIILADPQVKGVLVNIFGGIVRCDLIAEGIIGAVSEVGVSVPVVVRLEGNNAAIGRKRLAECDFNILPASSLTQAAEMIVEVVGGAE